jgi:serine/threonine-protein kinase RIO1
MEEEEEQEEVVVEKKKKHSMRLHEYWISVTVSNLKSLNYWVRSLSPGSFHDNVLVLLLVGKKLKLWGNFRQIFTPTSV